MKTWHVYGAFDPDGETELLGAILADDVYEAIGKANEQFGDYFIDEITLDGHGMSAPTVQQTH